MARIYIPYGVTGVVDLYARFRDEDGKVRRGDNGTYEVYNATNIALYGADVGSATPYYNCIEYGSTGGYYVEIPDATAKSYSVYLQAGAAPSENDVEIAADRIGLDATAAAQTQAAAAAAITAAAIPAGVVSALGNGSSLTEAGGTGDHLTGIPGLGSSGSGGNTIQFEITNSSGTLLENATVTLRLNDILKATGNTLVTGRLASTGLAVAATGTYELSVTCDGYNGHTADLVVTAGVNTMVEVELASLSFSPPADADQVTAWGYVYNESGVAESGATVYLEQVTAGARNIYDSKRRTLTANVSGLVSGAVWADGSEYRMSRDGINWSDDFEPSDDGDVDLPNSFRLPGLVGAS